MGSLYDALYGTDMISESEGAIREGGYNPIRGDRVIAFAKIFLDETFLLRMELLTRQPILNLSIVKLLSRLMMDQRLIF